MRAGTLRGSAQPRRHLLSAVSKTPLLVPAKAELASSSDNEQQEWHNERQQKLKNLMLGEETRAENFTVRQ